MKFDASTPRANLTIGDATFTCPAVFAAGHVLTEGEAQTLNQTLRENVRNNLAHKTKPGKAKDGTETPAEGLTQDEVDAYVAEYEMGLRRGGGGGEARLSPVERKARQIAREKVLEALKKKGLKIDTKTEDGKKQMETLVAQVAAKPEVIKEAEKQLKAVERIALEDLDLGESAAEETQAAA